MLFSIVVAILLCLFALVCLCGSVGRITLPNNVLVSSVLAFGDSYVDQGNNNYINTTGKVNYHPYGEDFVGGIPTGRFSNGKTIPDFLAEALGVKEYVPPFLDPVISDKDLQTGVSFASGGSGLDPLTTEITTAIPMSVQVDLFKQYIERLRRNINEEAANNIITNSLVVLVVSTNDLLVSFPLRSSQYDALAYSNMLVKLVLNFIQEVYTLGVRRMVVFSAPPIGCLPEVRTVAGGPQRRCGDKENNLAQLYNTILEQQLQFWTTSFPQSGVTFFDYYNPLINIIENPKKYGFDVVDKGCCGTGKAEVLYLCNKLTPTCPDRSKYLFWDGLHITEKGYNIIVDQLIQDLMNSFF
ncbi:hypothetical protein SSX86_019917 [Deinandra increscens subsp. villosa]|uniref:Uncharacterized protein n=1 Tax=Deinandra increscens subsp. villosa TaxID=3103831 RepID=A0AAP0GTH3_9ASTR